MYRYLAVIVTLALLLILDVVISHGDAHAQVNQTGQNTIFTPNNNIANGSSNDTGIMQNTSGVIDDAFEALKDSFGSFFGK